MTSTTETPNRTFRKKPVEIVADQWWKNGDHPADSLPPADKVLPGERTEGRVVRYFRRPEPEYASQSTHEPCGRTWHDHGWIDTLEGGHTVCPGDWIVTGIQGERYPCKPDIFEATYEAASEKTVRTYRVQYNPGQDIDADSETFIDAERYERITSGLRSRVVFTREGRTVAEVSEGNVILIEEMDYTPEDRAARAAAMGRHPAGSELDDDGKPTPEAVLALPMDDNDSGADTVRGYLVALAAGVWTEGEGFSGKRPFGNSGWHTEIYQALGAKGWIRCVLDSDGYVEDIDEAAGNELIAAALRHLAAAPAA